MVVAGLVKLNVPLPGAPGVKVIPLVLPRFNKLSASPGALVGPPPETLTDGRANAVRLMLNVSASFEPVRASEPIPVAEPLYTTVPLTVTPRVPIGVDTATVSGAPFGVMTVARGTVTASATAGVALLTVSKRAYPTLPNPPETTVPLPAAVTLRAGAMAPVRVRFSTSPGPIIGWPPPTNDSPVRFICGRTLNVSASAPPVTVTGLTARVAFVRLNVAPTPVSALPTSPAMLTVPPMALVTLPLTVTLSPAFSEMVVPETVTPMSTTMS